MKSTEAAQTESSIINEIIDACDPQEMINDLEEMFDAHYLHTNNPSADYRSSILTTYRVLCSALKQMKSINLGETNNNN